MKQSFRVWAIVAAVMIAVGTASAPAFAGRAGSSGGFKSGGFKASPSSAFKVPTSVFKAPTASPAAPAQRAGGGLNIGMQRQLPDVRTNPQVPAPTPTTGAAAAAPARSGYDTGHTTVNHNYGGGSHDGPGFWTGWMLGGMGHHNQQPNVVVVNGAQPGTAAVAGTTVAGGATPGVVTAGTNGSVPAGAAVGTVPAAPAAQSSGGGWMTFFIVIGAIALIAGVIYTVLRRRAYSKNQTNVWNQFSPEANTVECPVDLKPIVFFNQLQEASIDASTDDAKLAQLSVMLAEELLPNAKRLGSTGTPAYALTFDMLEVVRENGRYVASVKYSAVDADSGEHFEEVWHFTRIDGSTWKLAGIQQI